MFDARAFILKLQAESVRIETDGNDLLLSGNRYSIAAHLEEIRRRKPALLWQLRHMDSEVFP